MKKLYTLSFLILFAFAAHAQNFKVTLAVDMTNETSVDSVSVAGNWQAIDANMTGIGDWTPGKHFLFDDNSNGLYQIDISIPAGTYEYKFLNGSAWGTDEGGGLDATCGVDNGINNFNREMTISSDTIFKWVFNTCTESTLALSTSTKQISNVTTFKVAPNPFSHNAVITIDNANSNTHDVIMTNIAGGVVRTMNAVQGHQITVERGDLVSGIYFVTLINEKGERGTKKLVIH